MTKAIVVVGSQWGDEGKGKITNYLSNSADVVVRYQGGDNAGHTIQFNNQTYALHLIPSGIFNSHCLNVIGNGVVFNPQAFAKEITQLQKAGFACQNLAISDRAHVIFNFHQMLDGASEAELGASMIGTTKKGIGPTYTDKAARTGLRVGDLVGESFPAKYQVLLNAKNEQLSHFNLPTIDYMTSLKEYQILADIIKPYVKDTTYLVNEALDNNKRVLFEGAQGILLDIDFGTYPFVTSSNPSGGGVCTGSGIGPTRIDKIIGITKAYTTRVGSGAFPTELFNDTATYIRETGHEYGTTTKRPRRIGWLDLVALKYSIMVGGITNIALMLLDVLSNIEELNVCTAYEIDGVETTHFPSDIDQLARVKPHYETLSGWCEDISKVTKYSDLPTNAQKYIAFIEQYLNVPISIVSVGPDQCQTIIRENLLEE